MFTYSKFVTTGYEASTMHTWDCDGYQLVILFAEGHKPKASVFTPAGKPEIKFTAVKKNLYVEHPVTWEPTVTPEGAFAEKVAQGMQEIIDSFKGRGNAPHTDWQM